MALFLDMFTLLFVFLLTLIPATAYVQPFPRLADGRKIISNLGSNRFNLTRSMKTSRYLNLLARQGAGGTEGPCGAGVGACADGYCCSEAG